MHISGSRSKYQHLKEGLIFCLRCKIYKDGEEFDGNTKKPYRLCKDSRCKKCKSEQRIIRRNERRTSFDSLDRLLTERYCGVKERVKNKELLLDFDRDFLKELWIKQKGLCAISKIPMTHVAYSGRINTNISVDRIDSNIRYLKSNTQLVCVAINQMKNDLTMDELLYFCEQIVKNK